MVEKPTYKHPNKTLDNMHTRSNMKGLEEQVQSLQKRIDNWDHTLDHKLDEKLERNRVHLDKLDDDIKDLNHKLDDDIKHLNHKLDTLINQGRPTKEPLKEWHFTKDCPHR